MNRLFASLVLLLLLSSGLSAADLRQVTGKVVGVHDGDTVTVLHGKGKKLKVRLEGIDAPETNQPFGDASRQALDTMVYGKVVTVVPTTVDKYGRTVGRVWLRQFDVNREMVRIGLAWWYDHYSQEAALAQAQQQARYYHWGLWQDSHPTPPWVWRDIHPLR